MKYFLDTEFLEGTQKTWLGHTKPTIDLISIGLVAEDGREYYAISKDFNLKEAWNRYDIKKLEGTYNPTNTNTGYTQKVYWIRDNVLLPIYQDKVHGDVRNHITFTYSNMKWLISRYGKTNKQIAKEIVDFINSEPVKQTGTSHTVSQLTEESVNIMKRGYLEPEFYAYYASYDWVAFCWLFGKMIELPKGFPMFPIDIKPMFDAKANSLSSMELSKLTECENCTHNVLSYLDETNQLDKVKQLKKHKEYPKETNAHNALSDAKWNFELYKFLDAI